MRQGGGVFFPPDIIMFAQVTIAEESLQGRDTLQGIISVHL